MMGVMSEQIVIDGAQGEGGGQILRTSVALALSTGRPLRIDRIRARRDKPGLLRQHLTAVQAAVAVSGGRATGDVPGSATLEFVPGQVRGGEYRLSVGTAGSATLVLQTILPALMLAREASRLILEGGTHNPMAPSFDFIERAFLPVLARMGARVTARLEAWGFYPAGGGRFVVDIEPAAEWTALVLMERGPVTIEARGVVASLPDKIAHRELGLIRTRFGLDRQQSRVVPVDNSPGPGNVLIVDVKSAEVTEVVTGFGLKGIRAEAVAESVGDEVQKYLDAGVPVGEHLADQLLLPMALASGGAFRTLEPTLHTTTNADVIRQVLGTPIAIGSDSTGAGVVRVGSHVKEVTYEEER